MTVPALPAGARIVKRGSFRLDRERAQDKIAKFQLDDPRAYVLELIAAGVCAGAPRIELRIGPRDLEITWDGEAPGQHELGDLFEWVFTPVQSRHARMMQHLAQAVYGARGLQPAAIVLEVPGLRADLTDPLRPVFGEGEQRRGVRIVVRERFELLRHSLGTVTWVFGQAQELRLLRQRAALCPTPVHLGGGHTIGVDRLALPTASKFHYVTSDAFLWIEVFDGDGSRLSDRYPALLGTRTTVAIVRDGITIVDHALRSGNAVLCGWVHADELQLDVSRARVVQDERWKALVAQLAEIRDELIARLEQPLHASGRPPPAALAPLRRIAAAQESVVIADLHAGDRGAPTENVDTSTSAPIGSITAGVAASPEPARPNRPAASIATQQGAATPTAEHDNNATQQRAAPPTAEHDDAMWQGAAPPTAERVLNDDSATQQGFTSSTPLRDDAAAVSPLDALRFEIEVMLGVAVDRPTLERTCEALLRDLPRLGVAFLRDPAGVARTLLAWQVVDRLQLASGKPSLAVDMAQRVARALDEAV